MNLKTCLENAIWNRIQILTMDLFREQLFQLSQCKRKARILLRVRFAQVERIETHKIRKLDVYDAHTDHPT